MELKLNQDALDKAINDTVNDTVKKALSGWEFREASVD